MKEPQEFNNLRDKRVAIDELAQYYDQRVNEDTNYDDGDSIGKSQS